MSYNSEVLQLTIDMYYNTVIWVATHIASWLKPTNLKKLSLDSVLKIIKLWYHLDIRKLDKTLEQNLIAVCYG